MELEVWILFIASSKSKMLLMKKTLVMKLNQLGNLKMKQDMDWRKCVFWSISKIVTEFRSRHWMQKRESISPWEIEFTDIAENKMQWSYALFVIQCGSRSFNVRTHLRTPWKNYRSIADWCSPSWCCSSFGNGRFNDLPPLAEIFNHRHHSRPQKNR